MLSVGDRAPTFELPAFIDSKTEAYSLQSALDRDRTALLLFYPFDFSPVCTTELCAIRDAEWFQFTPNLDVIAISGDSTYAHQAFAEEYGLNFPLLSDFNGDVASQYDVCYDEFQDHAAVPKRSVFLVDSNQTVQYAWSADDAFETPDFVPVKDALDELAELNESLAPEGVELEVDYEQNPDTA